MVRKIALAALFLLLQNFLFAAGPLSSNLDERAVNFSLEDIKSQRVSLSDFKDKPLILFFWTTWCPYCRKELKKFSDTYEKLAKAGIGLLAINIGESSVKVDNFTKNFSLLFPVLLDTDASVASIYKILGVPTYVLIDKKGRIVSRRHYFSEEMHKEITSK